MTTKPTLSLWVFRERKTQQYWNGFGFTPVLEEARTYSQPLQPEDIEWMPLIVDLLELRLMD